MSEKLGKYEKLQRLKRKFAKFLDTNDPLLDTNDPWNERLSDYSSGLNDGWNACSKAQSLRRKVMRKTAKPIA